MILNTSSGLQDPNARNCHGYRKFVKRTVLESPESGYLVNDTIIIRYTIELVVSSGGALQKQPSQPVKNNEITVSIDMASPFNSCILGHGEVGVYVMTQQKGRTILQKPLFHTANKQSDCSISISSSLDCVLLFGLPVIMGHSSNGSPPSLSPFRNLTPSHQSLGAQFRSIKKSPQVLLL